MTKTNGLKRPTKSITSIIIKMRTSYKLMFKNHTGAQEAFLHIGLMETVVGPKRWMPTVILNTGPLEKRISIERPDNHGSHLQMRLILHLQATHSDLALPKQKLRAPQASTLIPASATKHRTGVMATAPPMKRWTLGNILRTGAQVVPILTKKLPARLI